MLILTNLNPNYICPLLKRILKLPAIFASIKMSAFIQRLNPITGQSDWVIQNEDYDYHQEVARAAFADMLHDTERNVMYEQGLKVAIDHMHKRGKKANVLDIGTGTGLLSMMAVRHGADSVVACEAFTPMSKCALQVIAMNGLADKIKVIPKRSTDLIIGEDMENRANILVTEVFDTELIGEGALSTFKHAHDELLEDNCVVVPHSAKIYAQVIDSPVITNWNRLKNVYDEDGVLLIKVPVDISDCKGSTSLHDVQVSQLPTEFIRTVSSPQAVICFDWSGKTPFMFNRSTINSIKAEVDGTARAVLMWWDLNMDIENKVVLSCAPFWAHPSGKGKDKIPWRDHWMQAIYYLPKELNVKQNEELHLIFCHDEYSLWFNMRKDLKVSDDDLQGPVCNCGVHLTYARTRIGMLNDSTRTKKYLSIIERNITSETVVLILSHGLYAALAAAKTAKWVYCLESNMLSRRVMQDFIDVNNLTNVEIIQDPNDFVPKNKIDFVIGEPYFISSILPWDNLLFLYLLKDMEPHFTDGVTIFPKLAKIRGVPMEFDNLHKIRAPLGKCQDFLMEPFDKLILSSSDISDENMEAQPLWEYPGRALADAEDMATIDLSIPKDGLSIETQGVFNTNGIGICNGIALWVDWVLDTENPKKYTVTTGPVKPIEIGENVCWDMHTRQGVCLLGHLNMNQVIKYSFKFSFDTGNISFKINP